MKVAESITKFPNVVENGLEEHNKKQEKEKKDEKCE